MKKIANTLFFLFLSLIVFSQSLTYQPEKHFTVVYYNVENLFDTIDSPGIRDEEFTPEGSYRWDTKRYRKKIEDLSRVLSTVNPGELPEVIGLSEIENKMVLKDLINSNYLKRGNYEIVFETGPDLRGINVALIFRMDEFTYLSHRAIPVSFPFAPESKTRDIFYVKGLAADNDTMHLFVNHWPSRLGGQAETEPRRIFAAMTLRNAVDSIFRINPVAKILAMGDFNDEPTNASVFSFLNANNKRRNYNYNELYNMMFDLHNFEDDGTLLFRGNWNMLDHIIVSRAFFDKDFGFSLNFDSGKSFRAPWMLEKANRDGIQPPFRTFAGQNYLGGVSDHLPVYVIMTRNQP